MKLWRYLCIKVLQATWPIIYIDNRNKKNIKKEVFVVAKRSSSSKKAQGVGKSKIRTVMREYKHGELHSGEYGPRVKSRKQAVAIALNQARKSGAYIPKKKSR
jgi:hypothetical protein